MSLRETFAKNLKELRKRNNLTQEQFAELVNVAPRHISFIETGRSFPSCDLLERICHELHADYTKLFELPEPPSREKLLEDLEYTVQKLNTKQLNYIVKVAKELY